MKTTLIALFAFLLLVAVANAQTTATCSATCTCDCAAGESPAAPTSPPAAPTSPPDRPWWKPKLAGLRPSTYRFFDSPPEDGEIDPWPKFSAQLGAADWTWNITDSWFQTGATSGVGPLGGEAFGTGIVVSFGWFIQVREKVRFEAGWAYARSFDKKLDSKQNDKNAFYIGSSLVGLP